LDKIIQCFANNETRPLMSLLFKYMFDRCYSLHLEETPWS